MALAVTPPAGWIEDPVLAPHVAVDLGITGQVFHPPGDTTDLLVVESPATSERPMRALADVVQRTIDRLNNTGAYVDTRTSQTARGRVIDEATLALPDGARMHLRASYTVEGPPYDGVLAMCTGRGAAYASCEGVLSGIAVAEVAAADDQRLLYILGAIAGLGVVAFAGAARWRALHASPPLVEGEIVTVTGIARAVGDTIEAPLSSTRCLVHRTRARAFVDGGTLEPSEHAVAPFDVETRHGRVRVQVAGLALDVTPTRIDGDTPAHRAFRARHAVLDGHDASFDEIVVVPGQRITIRGRVASELDAGRDRDAGPRVALLVAPGDDPVTIIRVW